MKVEVNIKLRKETISFSIKDYRFTPNHLKKELIDGFPIIENSDVDQIFDHQNEKRIITFTPYSEYSYEKLFDFVCGNDFYSDKFWENFKVNVVPKNTEDKIIYVLFCFSIEHKFNLLQGEVASLLLSLFKEYVDDNSLRIENKPIYDSKNKFTNYTYEEIDQLMHEHSSFKVYQHELTNQLSQALNAAYHKFNLFNLKGILSSKDTLLNKYKSLYELAPLLLTFDEWNSLIKHEFSLLINQESKDELKAKLLAGLESLKSRVVYDRIPALKDKYYNSGFLSISGEPHGQFIVDSSFSKSDFKNDVQTYIDHVNDAYSIKYESLINRKGITAENNFNKNYKKINLKISPKALLSTMIDFFERNDVVIDDDKKSRIRRFIVNVFDYNSKYSFSSSSEGTINFLNKELTKNLCFLMMLLKKSGSIDYKSDKQIYSALSGDLKNSNIENIGFGKVALKDRFSEIRKNPKLINSIPKQIGFTSYTYFISTLKYTK